MRKFEVIDQDSVIKETHIWLRGANLKGENCFAVIEMDF